MQTVFPIVDASTQSRWLKIADRVGSDITSLTELKKMRFVFDRFSGFDWSTPEAQQFLTKLEKQFLILFKDQLREEGQVNPPNQIYPDLLPYPVAVEKEIGGRLLLQMPEELKRMRDEIVWLRSEQSVRDSRNRLMR